MSRVGKEMSQNGQSLFEVVIAIAVSAIIVVSLVSLAASSIRNSTFARNKTIAARYSEEATEWLRGQRDSDIDTFKTNSLTSIWCLKSLDWSQSSSCDSGDVIPGTTFTREVNFSEDATIPETIIEASIIVFWSDAQGRHEVRSATNFTDWRQR